MIFSDSTYDANHFVTKSTAEHRAEHIKNVKYEVGMALPKGELFYGDLSVNFDLIKMPAGGKDLFLDFRGL